MRRVFADTCHLVALINRKDGLYETARKAQAALKLTHVVTTDEVLAEFLNYYSSWGPSMRIAAVQSVEGLRKSKDVTVVEQSRSTFDTAFELYKNRGDKLYSLADCVSFELMRRDGLSEVLTNDHHFEQEGFVPLLIPRRS